MATTWMSRSRLMIAVGIVAVISLVIGPAGPSAAQSAPAAQPVPADSPPAKPPAVSVGASATVVSAFVWRGWVIADGGCLQPSAWIKAGGLTATAWANVWPHNEGDSFTEHDFTLDYTRPAGPLQLSVGYINYFFASLDTDRWTNELYVGAAVPGLLNPSLRVYQDVHQGTGTYVSLGVSHGVTAGSKGLSITPSAALGYNNNQWVDGSGWSDLSVGVLFAVPLGGHVDASASVNYSRSLNQDWFPSKTWGGLTLAVH